MVSEVEFDSRDYHLHMMIEQMERDGRSEHAIENAVRIASARPSAAQAPATKSRAPGDAARGFNRWFRRVRPSGSSLIEKS
jgi:hypothetical protein